MLTRRERYHGFNPIMITSKREHRSSRLTTFVLTYRLHQISNRLVPQCVILNQTD